MAPATRPSAVTMNCLAIARQLFCYTLGKCHKFMSGYSGIIIIIITLSK